ncbi:MAG: hypothetical protein PVH77_08885, partial [Phycisphaerales bacterium]
VISPQYEKPDKLRSFVLTLRKNFANKDVIIDPQFYVGALQGPKKEGRLPEYPYYRSNLTRRSLRSPKNISLFVKDSLDYQMTLNVTHLITPTVLFNGIDEPFFEFSLQLAEASIEHYSTLSKPPPLFLSLVMSEDILKKRSSTDLLLDEITLYQASGFYIVIDHSLSSYEPQFNHMILSNLLYLTYSLSQLNNFKIIFGYSSFVGLLLHAVGATSTACGWFGTSRKFSLSRFRPSSGGRPARPRYSSIPLLNSILVTPELSACSDVGLLDKVLTGTSFDGIFRSNTTTAQWSIETSTLHHWEALTGATQVILKQGDTTNRLHYLLDSIEHARSLYVSLRKKGVQFEVRSAEAHLEKWEMAISEFIEAISI